ncbi:death-inducer obliterator 1 [Capsicum chacoense]
MSSNLVSQQFSGPPDGQLVQMDHVSSNPDPVAHKQTSIVGHMPNISESHQFVWSSETTANRFDTTVPANQSGQMGPRMNSQHFMLSHQQTSGDRYVPNSPGVQKSSVLTKRKAGMESVLHGSTTQVSSMPNKRTAQGASLSQTPGFVQQSSAIKKPGQQQSKLTSGASPNLSVSSKKMTRNESISNRSASQRSQTPKGRTIQVESTSKAQSESSDAIRSKMRESLASALAMACQNPVTVVNAAKDSGEAVGSQPSQLNVTPTTANEGLPQTSVSHIPQNSGDVLPSTGAFSVDGNNDSQSSCLGLHDDVSMGNSVPCSNEFELHVDDVPFSDNFFVKDELLQGNGLTWAMDLDMQLRETDFLQDAEKANLFDEVVVEDEGELAKSSPEDLALQIEAELFKLFGGVNKKYKEKGRSLLFNLKDRNNPDLRERVMSGEIPPDKLCSMTAEELASKELSEWRVAKAEELAQMVVLPDNAIDMRRLVKKTHKGEYQVDFERDDNNIAAEISAGSTVSQFMPKIEKGRKSSPSGADEIGSKGNVTSQHNSSEKQDVKDSLVIPADGTDLMQGMVVEEFKDAEFLPPIVSLDEFMESLDSEPPFENLPVEKNHSASRPDKESSEDPNKVVGSGLAAKGPAVASADKAIEGTKNHVEQKEALVSTGSPVVKKVTSSGNAPFKSTESLDKVAGPRGGASTFPCIWEGSLQLTISSLVTVLGSFRSGEKTPTNEWSSSLEIKGRVRLDAFEKFLQELPMSRSRAVMVVQFVLKDKSSESERASLSEAVDSYASDERLGFAEPAPGVELYLCPPHILDMIGKKLSKDPKELYDSTENGLIGVVVWRKLHISSTISPNSSSHHKHGLKKQQMTPRGQHEKDRNVNVNSMPKGIMPMPSKHDPAMDDDDDIPPGFGPKAGRDDDDLPEFNFSGNINASRPRHPAQNMSHGSRMAPYNQPVPSRPIDHMRELILKYGQTGSASSNDRVANVGLGIEPWNDDDDDIPEWRPQAPPALQRPPYPLDHSYPRPHVAYQRPLATPIALPMQPPINNGTPSRPQIMSPRGQYQVDWRRARGF